MTMTKKQEAKLDALDEGHAEIAHMIAHVQETLIDDLEPSQRPIYDVLLSIEAKLSSLNVAVRTRTKK